MDAETRINELLEALAEEQAGRRAAEALVQRRDNELAALQEAAPASASKQKINELVEEAKRACVDAEKVNPDWFEDDPRGAMKEAIANSLGEHNSFLEFVAADSSLANRDVEIEGSSTSLEHIAWVIVYRIVLKRIMG